LEDLNALYRHGDHSEMVTMTFPVFGHGRRRDGRGQGLVEFALVFPLIILIIFGIFDLGRAVYAYNTLANAARQGARVAAVNQAVNKTAPNSTLCQENMPVEDVSNPDWSIKACAAQSAVSLGVQTSDVTVSYSSPSTSTLTCTAPSALDLGCIATVTVAYTWTPMTPVISNILGSISMSSTSQMPIERVFP
jgi:Flp pilus assembly protein TadG